MNLPNRAVSRLVEMIRAWPDLKRMLYDYLGKVVIESREDGGPTGQIAPQFTTELYYATQPIPYPEWFIPVAAAPPWPAAASSDAEGLRFYQFDAVSTEEIRFIWCPPEGFDPTADSLTIRLYHAASATHASTGIRVRFGVAPFDEGDNLATVSFTQQAKTIAVGNVGILQIDEVTLATGLADVVETDMLIGQVYRDGGHADDTCPNDWNLYHLEMRYRNDSLGRYP